MIAARTNFQIVLLKDHECGAQDVPMLCLIYNGAAEHLRIKARHSQDYAARYQTLGLAANGGRCFCHYKSCF